MWIESLLVLLVCMMLTSPRVSWKIARFFFRRMGPIKIITLVLIGGTLGAISWLIWMSVIACAWWYAGAVTAIGVSVVVGKITTPLWLVGMTYESARRCPLIGKVFRGMRPFWETNYQSVIGSTIILATLVGIAWACWPQ